MAVYDTRDDLQRQNLLTRLETLIERGSVVELTEKAQRTLSQNNYLHAVLGYFAYLYGERLEYVKNRYYKQVVNGDLFVRTREDRWLGTVGVLRSTRDLSKDEMTISIERFRDWAAKEAGIYIPSAEDARAVRQMELVVMQNKRFI